MSMTGKRVLITGATSGIGEATALGLARQGAEIIILSRNAQRCQETVTRIQQQTDNPHISFMVVDLSSLADVRRVADEFCAKHPSLDVLINNAGATYPERRVSVDGYEMTFALNHLSYFLLTHLLLDTLKVTAQQTGEARIVNVASDAHRFAKIHWQDMQAERHYFGMAVYGRTKLMNLMFTYELAKRLAGTNISVNAVHPGMVNTRFADNVPKWIQWLAVPLLPWLESAEKASQTLIYLASSPQVKGLTSNYFAKQKAMKSSAASYDEAAWVRLWQLSEQLVMKAGDVKSVSTVV